MGELTGNQPLLRVDQLPNHNIHPEFESDEKKYYSLADEMSRALGRERSDLQGEAIVKG